MALGPARASHVCPFCESRNRPSLCATCVTASGEQQWQVLKRLLKERAELEEALERQLKGQVLGAHAVARADQSLARKQKLKRQREQEAELLRREKATCDLLRITLASRASKLKHAQQQVGLASRRQPLNGDQLPEDQQMANRLVVLETVRTAHAKTYLRQLKELFPLKLTKTSPPRANHNAGSEGVTVCGMRLPLSDASLASLPPAEISTALGYMLQLLDLASKYLFVPLLHIPGFGASVSRIWQRSSYWRPAPSSMRNVFLLYRQGLGIFPSPSPPRTCSGPIWDSLSNAQGRGSVERQLSLGGAKFKCREREEGGDGVGTRTAKGIVPGCEDASSSPHSSWQAQDVVFSECSSLFESPSWHSVLPVQVWPPPPPPAAAQYEGSRGRGRDEATPRAQETSALKGELRAQRGCYALEASGVAAEEEGEGEGEVGEEMLSLRQGLLLLERSLFCLCLAQSREGHGGQWQQRTTAVGFAAAGGTGRPWPLPGEAFVSFARTLSSLCKDRQTASPGGSNAVSSSLMASAPDSSSWGVGSFKQRSEAPAGAVAAVAAAPGGGSTALPGTVCSAQAAGDRHFLSCSRPPQGIARATASGGPGGTRGDGGSLQRGDGGTGLGRAALLGNSLVLDYIPAPQGSSGDNQVCSIPPPGAQVMPGTPGRILAFPNFFRGPRSHRNSGMPKEHRGVRAGVSRAVEDEWDVVEPVVFPPPPSRPEDVEHWTRAMFLDAAK